MHLYANRTVSMVDFCDGTTQICMGPGESIVLITTIALGIILNAAHILILSNVPCLQNRPFLKVLVGLSVSDILNGLLSFIQYNCMLKEQLYHHPRDIFIFVITTLGGTGPAFRFYILCLTLFERYYIVCRNLFYKENIILNNLGITFVVVFIVVLVLNIITTIVLSDHICLHNVAGILIQFSSPDSGAFIGCMLFVPIVASLFFAVKLLIGLKHSIRESADQQISSKIKSAARYILVITILYVTLFTLPALSFMLQPSLGSAIHILDYLSVYAYELYGILNIMAYVCVSASYRRQVKKIVSAILPTCYFKKPIDLIPCNPVAISISRSP